MAESEATDRAAHLEELIHDPRDPPNAAPGVPPPRDGVRRLVFPPLYLRVLDALARHTDVEFLAVLPAGARRPRPATRSALPSRSASREFVQVLGALPSAPEPRPLTAVSPEPLPALGQPSRPTS